jgi:hypothetical protein
MSAIGTAAVAGGGSMFFSGKIEIGSSAGVLTASEGLTAGAVSARGAVERGGSDRTAACAG